MKPKLDIFKTLEQIDKKNHEFFEYLTLEEQKGFLPVVVQKWLSGINSEQQIMMLNEFVNPFVHQLYKHPSLIYKSMTVCTSGHKQRYKWTKKKKDNNINYKIDIISKFYDYSKRIARDMQDLIPDSDITEMAMQLEYTSEEIKKIKKLYG